MKKQLKDLENKMDLLIDNGGEALGSLAAPVAVQGVIYTDVIDQAFLAVTINHPRVASFIKLTSMEQQKYLSRMFDKISSKFDCHSRHIFEYSKDGNLHLHGFIHMNREGFIAGAINDVAKIALREMKRPVGKDNFYYQYLRYRCPSVCVQYFPPERECEWKTYMNKFQVIPRKVQDIDECIAKC